MISFCRPFGNRFKPVLASSIVLLAATVFASPVAQAVDRASKPNVKIAKTGWAFYGNVSNAQLQPVAGYSVFFVNASKVYQAQFGLSYTDNSGAFIINYSGVRAAAAGQLFAEVVNAAGSPVYTCSTPFQPSYGNATFQKIVLPPSTGARPGKPSLRH